MSVLGLGTDLVDIPRMARLLDSHGDRFLARCFRPGEIPDGPRPAAVFVAGRWAAKEALLKALGANVRNIPYHDIEIVADPEGPVSIVLHGLAHQALERRGGGLIHLSISHERAHALAVVIIGS